MWTLIFDDAFAPEVRVLDKAVEGHRKICCEWRVAYAFDPERKAILLAAVAKGGRTDARAYGELLKTAEERFERQGAMMLFRTVLAAAAAGARLNMGNVR